MRRAPMTQARKQRDRRRLAASAAVAARLVAARRINRWGATAQEVTRVLPGVDWISWRDSSWLFLVEPIDAEHSRLIERGRTAVTGRPGSMRGALTATPVGRLGLAAADFVMAHHHMQGIKQRAERQWLTSGSIVDHGGMGKDGM